MNTILVQLADKPWTQQALHLACALARHHEARVILLRMVRVQHLSWLGTDLATMPLSDQEAQDLEEHAATAEDYGVTLTVQPVQYHSLATAFLDVAVTLNAQVLLARLPESAIPHWRTVQEWILEQRLRRLGCQLYTLEQPPGTLIWAPTVTARVSE